MAGEQADLITEGLASEPVDLDSLQDAEELATAQQPPSPAGFDSLVGNGLDFLTRAIGELKKDPKYSVIHFSAGIELLLKARLLREHWSLVVSKPGDVSKQEFLSGNFDSVTLRQTIERLENVCGESLSEEYRSFSKLAAHRNRAIHFFHDIDNPSRELKEQIAATQLAAGALLMRVLRHRWSAEFQKYSEQLAELERSLRTHKQYLKQKFKLVRNDLAAIRNKGGRVEVCFFCNMLSAEVVEDDEPVKRVRCHTCDWSRSYISVTCPNCNESEIEFDAAEGTCDNCDTYFDIGFLLGEFGSAEAYCPECSFSAQQSVVEYGDGYLCLSCATEYDRVGSCGWCNEDIAGDTSDSYLSGCMFCDGLFGHDSDD